MFCPKCAKPKAEGRSQFCTGCGFDLTGLDDFVLSGGALGSDARYRKGIRHGVTMLLIGIVLVPVWMFIGPMFPPHDTLVESAPSTTLLEQLFWIVMWMSFLAGAARIVYAYLFEQASRSRGTSLPHIQQIDTEEQRSLPSADYFKPADPGQWRSTEELFEPVLNPTRTSGELR
jgi:hypothetical protein